jgi:hypothetical protein
LVTNSWKRGDYGCVRLMVIKRFDHFRVVQI